jgi:energy-coupling factor transporter transmembrane protein EcfT
MSLQPFGNVLIKWNQPNAYFRKKLTAGKFNWFFLVLAILLLLILVPNAIHRHPVHKILFIVLPFLFIFILYLFSIWFCFSSSSVVRITDDAIIKSGRSYFKNIESCDVHSESYRDTKFYILKLILKEKNEYSFLKPKQLSEVIVPENVNLEQVLKILRDKGIKVVGQPLIS